MSAEREEAMKIITRNRAARLSEEDRAKRDTAIRADRAAGMKVADVASRHGVSNGQVSKIARAATVEDQDDMQWAAPSDYAPQTPVEAPEPSPSATMPSATYSPAQAPADDENTATRTPVETMKRSTTPTGATKDGRDAYRPAPQPHIGVLLRSFADIDDDVPTWAWTHDGKGRIPVGAMTLFAGRPGAGKSTAARWFAAQVTNGTLPGEWYGTPHNVAYIAAEESPKYSVKPSLRAAGADVARVFFPEAVTVAEDGETTSYHRIPASAMSTLASELRAADVRLVIVDPLMSVLGDGVDAHRSNEVREHLTPWMTLAEQIDGVVLGIVHLNKSGNGDVVAGINGSSAFGELARAAFGFSKDPESADGDRVMSQEKNSLGAEDLALTYRLAPVPVTTASGRTAEMPRFDIVGTSDRTVGDILRCKNQGGYDSDGDDSDEVRLVVLDYLESQGGEAPAGDVLKATRAAGLSDQTVKNRRKQIGVQTRRATGGPGFVWSLDLDPDTGSFPAERL
ncbi:AAA domain [Corynebacterium variabile]|uniref:AAA domain n=2 Tax=Corynebacterium variabile TaxID=1727 RepID=A0A0X2NNQ6_9CORY|nr:AAA domain [Corynebacterium variabile]